MITPPPAYDQSNEQRHRAEAQRLDSENHKRNRDIEVGRGCRLIFTDAVTGDRIAVTYENGVLTETPL